MISDSFIDIRKHTDDRIFRSEQSIFRGAQRYMSVHRVPEDLEVVAVKRGNSFRFETFAVSTDDGWFNIP